MRSQMTPCIFTAKAPRRKVLAETLAVPMRLRVFALKKVWVLLGTVAQPENNQP
jgi:hypothetical protein